MDIKRKLLGGSPSVRQIVQNKKSTEKWLPVQDIRNGIILTKDGRYLRIMELLPVNFLLKSEMEQDNLIYYFASYLKVAPDHLQFLVVNQKAEVAGYVSEMNRYWEQESEPKCRDLIMDNIEQVEYLAANRALTKRFFLVIQYEPSMQARADTIEAISECLKEEEQKACRYLEMCGVEVVQQPFADNFHLELLYELLRPESELEQKLPLHAFDSVSCISGIDDEIIAQQSDQLMEEALHEEELERENEKKSRRRGKRKKKKSEWDPEYVRKGRFSVPDLIAPSRLDLQHSGYLTIGDAYCSCLYVTGYGYNTAIGRSWLTPLLEAGEGVSISFTVHRQRKENILPKISRTTMLNRSRMREVDDTRQDFEELDSAISAGLYLKDQMARAGEEFYYLVTLIKITAPSIDLLNQRISRVQTLCTSLDLITRRCDYEQNEAFQMTLPLLYQSPDIVRKARRNALTSSVAAAFPFSSFEIFDRKGVMLGINLHNQSLCVLDPFDDRKYPNANMSILGMTGAGKTTLLQLLALRFREQKAKVIVIAPYKGWEYRQACEAIGGAYVKLAPSSSDCLNYMELWRKTLDPSAEIGTMEVRDDSLLANKISDLHMLFSLLEKDLSNRDMAALDRAFLDCYRNHGITYDNETVRKKRSVPDLKELYQLLADNPETEHLSSGLARLTTGSMASLGGQTNIDVDNDYIVIDVSENEKGLLPVVMAIALVFANGIIEESRIQKKVIIIDEIWRLIGSTSTPLVADRVLELAKLIRALGGSFINATQDLVDYFSLDDGKYGRAVLNACRTKIILPLEEEEAKLIQNELHLSDDETMQIVRNKRGEGLLCAGHNRVSISIQPTAQEYELITTSRQDLLRQMRNQRKKRGRKSAKENTDQRTDSGVSSDNGLRVAADPS